MASLIDEVWDVVKRGAEIICKEDADIQFDKSRKQAFEEFCSKTYNDISEYMENKDEPLDRHKQAAVFITSVIEAEVLKGEKKNGVFVANYVLAAEVGFSYMRKALNEKLKEKPELKVEPIKTFYFPKANSCPTDYFRIFYRNLYYANTNQDWHLNPLDIAERLFLLEYMTLEHSGIRPDLLREFE